MLVYLDDGQPYRSISMSWARSYKDEAHVSGPVKRIDQVLKVGDIVVWRAVRQQVEALTASSRAGALLALNPENGAIIAEVGGFSYSRSRNRAVQSNRQPGLSFKPYFYAAAFEHGFTPASMINDAPIVFADPSKPNGLWTPQNDDGSPTARCACAKRWCSRRTRLGAPARRHRVRYRAREYVTRFAVRSTRFRTICRWRSARRRCRR